MTTYDAVHFRIVRNRGSASLHKCHQCQSVAMDWAYQHNGDPELCDEMGTLYADDDNCYLPMCRACHHRMDILHNPELASDPTRARLVLASEHIEKMKKVGQNLGRSTAELRKTDPEFAAKMKEVGRNNIKVALAALQDPEKVRGDRAKAAGVANTIRRTCLECGTVAHPAAIGRHQKSSGHKGHTDNKEN